MSDPLRNHISFHAQLPTDGRPHPTTLVFRDTRFFSYEEYNQPARTRDERGHQLQSEIRQGLDSGPGQPWDAEALKKKARSRLGRRESG